MTEEYDWICLDQTRLTMGSDASSMTNSSDIAKITTTDREHTVNSMNYLIEQNQSEDKVEEILLALHCSLLFILLRGFLMLEFFWLIQFHHHFFLQNDTLGALQSQPNVLATDPPSPFINSPFTKYRGSIAWTEGFEKNLHVLAKNQYPDRAMGIFTSGGDAQGSQIP